MKRETYEYPLRLPCFDPVVPSGEPSDPARARAASDISAALSRIVSEISPRADENPNFPPTLQIKWEDASLKINLPCPLSAHERMTALPPFQEIAQKIAQLPMIYAEEDFFCAISLGPKPEFRFHISDLWPLSSWSLSTKVSAAHFAELAARLETAKIPEQGAAEPIRSFRVEPLRRGPRRIIARTPREAAHKYAVLQARTRKEARMWRETIFGISNIVEIHPHNTWRIRPA